MPLPVAHALVGASVVAAMEREWTSRRTCLHMLLAALLANAADLDFLLVYAQGSKTWHRAFTHSLVFSLFIFVLLALWLGRQKLKTAGGVWHRSWFSCRLRLRYDEGGIRYRIVLALLGKARNAWLVGTFRMAL